MKESVQWAIRWRFDAIRAEILNIKIAIRTKLFLLWYRDILGVVKGGENLRVSQRVRILGPGTVVLGKNVGLGYAGSPSFHVHEILVLTLNRDSVLEIGDNCLINNNNTFVVVRRIQIDESVSTGHDCQFYDSEMHSIDPVLRRTAGSNGAKQGDVLLSKNVMVGSQVTIGPGTRVGENSVVGMCTITKWKAYPEGYVIIGNPGRPIMNISDLLKSSKVEVKNE